MRKILFILLLLPFIAKSQAPPGYTSFPFKGKWFGGFFDTLHVPSGGTLPTSSFASGRIFYDTTGTDTGFYVYHKPYWVKLGGSSSASGIDDVLAVGQSLTNGRTLSMGVNLLDISGSQTELKFDNNNQFILMSANDDIRIDAPDVKLMQAPSILYDTTGSKILVRRASDGELFVTHWPTGTATIGGSIAASQVAVGSGVNTIQGSAALTFDGATLTTNNGASAVDIFVAQDNGTPSVRIADGGELQALAGLRAGNMYTSSTSANSNFLTFGGTLATNATTGPVLLPSGTASTVRAYINGNGATVITAGRDYGQMIIGKGVFTEAGSGTHPRGFGLAILQPTITDGVGATDTLAGLYVAGAPTGITAAQGRWSAVFNNDPVLIRNANLQLSSVGTTSTLAGHNLTARNTITGVLVDFTGTPGTVTSVATGYGLSGGTITTTGTLIADSTKLLDKTAQNIISGALKFTTAPTPAASGVTDLGTSSIPWGSLFLKSAGVINFNAGNFTATHTSGGLIFQASSDNSSMLQIKDAGGTVRGNIGTFPAASTYLFIGPSGTPSATNYMIAGNNSQTLLGAPTDMYGRINNSTIWNIFSTGMAVGNGNTQATARLHIGAGTTAASTAPLKFITGPVNTTAEAGAIEYTTPQLFFTNGGAQRQEIQQVQQSRVSTQFDKTDQTLANITGLTATLVASGIYRFRAELYTTSDVAGGIKVAIAGTATATAIVYDGFVIDAGLSTQTRSTALAGSAGAVTAVTAAHVTITGTITVANAGTLTVQSARNAAVGTTSILVGSTFVVNQQL